MGLPYLGNFSSAQFHGTLQETWNVHGNPKFSGDHRLEFTGT
jgi:hypothetical protein